MRRFLLPVACGLVQALSVVPGGGSDPSPTGSAASSLVGLGSGLLLALPSRQLQVLGGAVAGYLVQLLLAGAVLPVVVTVAAHRVSRHALLGEDGRPRRVPVLLLAASCLVLAAGPLSVGSDVAAQYVVLLLLALLPGLLAATRAQRDAARRRELVQAERLRLSRDLHDVVGHGMSAITVQAGAARLAMGAGDERAAVRALGEIEAAGRAVLQQVRWLVTLQRDDAERPDLAELPDLVAGARRSGLQVRLEVHGGADGVRGEVGEAAYRLVQEALTNVLRHAPDARADVVVEVGEDLRIEVVDDGAAPADSVVGNGIRGMQERAAALGGAVRAGPRPDGPGWSVSCRLPLQASR